MWQVLFEVPGVGLKIFGYGSMLVVAFFASIGLAARRARREGLDPEVVYDLAVWMIAGGLIGARAFYVLQYWGDRVNSVWEIFKIWEGGIVLYGSILGGAAASLLYWSIRRFPLRPMMDVVAPSLALGIALGRVGCFLNGCCFGDPCNLPWAVRFPAGSIPWNAQIHSGLLPPDALASLPVHPTQLYSTLDGLLLTWLLSAYYPLRRRDGEVMALMMLAYPVTRYLIELLRNDERAILGGMTISQIISLVIFCGGLLLWLALARLPLGRLADESATPRPTHAPTAGAEPGPGASRPAAEAV